MAIAHESRIFSDEIVAATDLKRNLKYWLDRAREIDGVTITQSSLADLALIRRDDIRAAYEALHYGDILIRFGMERHIARHDGEIVFPWLKYLSDEEREQFEHELFETYSTCTSMKDWGRLAMLLEDWKATAEAIQNAELMEAWRRRGRPNNYVSINEINNG